MSLITTLISAAEEAHEMPMPPLAYGAIAAAVFVVLGVVMWTYRDVANRHSDKTSGSDHHTPCH